MPTTTAPSTSTLTRWPARVGLRSSRTLATTSETAIERGDTYGPVSYLAYVPATLVFDWSGKWDSLPAAHATSIAFDLLAILGLALVGFRFGFALLHPRINRLRRQREREVTNDGAQRMLLPIIYAEGRTAMRVLQQGQAVEGAVGRILPVKAGRCARQCGLIGCAGQIGRRAKRGRNHP